MKKAVNPADIHPYQKPAQEEKPIQGSVDLLKVFLPRTKRP